MHAHVCFRDEEKGFIYTKPWKVQTDCKTFFHACLFKVKCNAVILTSITCIISAEALESPESKRKEENRLKRQKTSIVANY